MKATKKAHQNFHEFLKDDKTFEKESKGLLIEIESKTSEKKVTYEAKTKLLKLINFLLSLDFLKNISSKIPNPKDYKSKEIMQSLPSDSTQKVKKILEFDEEILWVSIYLHILL